VIVPLGAFGDKITLVLVQVKGPSLLAVTGGGVVLELTVADAVAVQPFAAVTVTVYVPALLAVMAAVVAPVLHE